VSTPALNADELAPPARGIRKAALIVVLLIVGLPFVLWYAPWRQNVGARGRVVAFDPLDRAQALTAPVRGRIVSTYVQEGSHVEAGEVILEMADLDPLYAVRLAQKVEFAREKLRAERESVLLLERQVTSLEQTRDLAVGVAQFELKMAEEKVRAVEQELVGLRAAREQKVADRVRKERLFERSLKSELDLQKAVAESESAVAKVSEAEAKLEISRHEESAKKASIEKVRSEAQVKLDGAQSKLEKTRGEIATAEKTLQEALTAVGRQETQTVVAPRAGVVLKINGAASSQLIDKGEILVEMVPDTSRLAAELWVRGNDAPLVHPGRQVRLQFEGWPAIQFVGWPSVARGTFGGVVALVDAQGDANGRFRILVEPDPDDVAWPDRMFLRQGVQVKGWVLLDEVSLGFEIWRQLNGFPPSLEMPPEPGAQKKPKKEGK
jgi:adhesin transport system membrane fusion protein